MVIDVTFDFTQDTEGYRDSMKKDKVYGLPSGDLDPDKLSLKLWEYQHRLYNGRKLPNGETFILDRYKRSIYWNGVELGNDSIIASVRWPTKYPGIKKVAADPNFRKWVDEFIGEAYTIGGEMLFPSKKRDGMETINQARGFGNDIVADRFDLTLKCIKGYYEKRETFFNGQLDRVLKAVERYSDFFDLFVDFRGYVDFFYLQGFVDDNYDPIKFLPDVGFPPVSEYYQFVEKQMECLRKRNLMISKLDI